jgi:hypothetical protein
VFFNGMVANQGVNASGSGVFDNGGRVRRRRVTPMVLALSQQSTDCCTVVGYLRRVVCQSIWSGRNGLGRIGALAGRQQRNVGLKRHAAEDADNPCQVDVRGFGLLQQ